jgi:hypothetical protein
MYVWPGPAALDLPRVPGAHRVGIYDAGWSSSVARWAHNPEVAGSNPAPATKVEARFRIRNRAFVLYL